MDTELVEVEEESVQEYNAQVVEEFPPAMLELVQTAIEESDMLEQVKARALNPRVLAKLTMLQAITDKMVADRSTNFSAACRDYGVNAAKVEAWLRDPEIQEAWGRRIAVASFLEQELIRRNLFDVTLNALGVATQSDDKRAAITAAKYVTSRLDKATEDERGEAGAGRKTRAASLYERLLSQGGKVKVEVEGRDPVLDVEPVRRAE